MNRPLLAFGCLLARRSPVRSILPLRSFSSFPVSSSSSSFLSGADSSCNLSPGLISRLGWNLHRQPHHPLALISQRIQQYFSRNFLDFSGSPLFSVHEHLTPRVAVKENFDDLLVPADHSSRRNTDTFYINKTECLRTHTSAHQGEFLRQGRPAFLVVGDCYRRDEIDARHYPVFHQMEGVRIFDRPAHSEARVIEDLQSTLSGLVEDLFGPVEKRWNSDYFPFTQPSFELEILFNGEWLEVLGCGVIRQEILNNALGEAVASKKIGWAFGLGLERLAMIRYNIPDIRLFWSKDERFLQQFRVNREKIEFQPFSKYPACWRDISFWLPENFHENDFSAQVRECAGDLVEKIDLVSSFKHPKSGAESRCYRIHYRSLVRSLNNEEINQIQGNVRNSIQENLKIQLR